jgi:hypothetical protein
VSLPILCPVMQFNFSVLVSQLSGFHLQAKIRSAVLLLMSLLCDTNILHCAIWQLIGHTAVHEQQESTNSCHEAQKVMQLTCLKFSYCKYKER